MYKTPQRMCIVCRKMFGKPELIRIVYHDGKVSIDKTHKASGRGAYLCKSKECFAKCCKTKALNRSFKTEIDKTTYDALAEEFLDKPQD